MRELEKENDKQMTGDASIDKHWLKYYTEEQKNTKMPQMTAYKYLYSCNYKHLNRIALSYFGRKITFKQLFDNINKTAKAFNQMGIKENEIVTVALPNIPEAVYIFYALSEIGAVSNMVDPRTSGDGIKSYIKEVNSRLLIIIYSYYNKVKDFQEDRIVENIMIVSPADSLPLGLCFAYRMKEFISSTKKIMKNYKPIRWNEFIKKSNLNDGNIEAKYAPNRAVVIEYTGGTTGKLKGVVLSNENINAVAIQSVLTGIDMQREHNWLDIMPSFIAYGVGMGLHLPLTIGMETILIPQFDAKKFDELIMKYKPIHMVGVPSYWGTIIKSKKLSNKDLSYMIAPTVGGDAMDTTLEREANKFLKEHNCTSKVTKGYGMTEVTGGVAGTVPANNEIGSVGIPFVKTIISIFDPETNEELTYNQNGEVCITGPNIMLVYYNNDEATRQVLRKHKDGKIWMHSSDIGYMTKNGNIFIVDRLKRMIIRYDGFKIFPSLIENVICLHYAVDSCKVVGIPDIEHRQGKLCKAYIVLKNKYKGKEEIKEEIKNLCLEKLPEYSQPFDYKIRETLPLTSIGKIDYLALEAEG